MRTIIKAKKIINGVDDNIIKDKCIIIKNGLINEIVNVEKFKPSHSDLIFNYNDEIIMPGMIDVHVHLAFSGITDNRSFRAESADMDYGAQALRGYRFALEHMSYGFTSLRDMNAPGNVAINIKNIINNKKLIGPNILACGLGLSITGGHMDQPGWGSHTNFIDMTYPCDGPNEFIKGVRSQLKAGADFIKTNMCVSSTYDLDHPYKQEMSNEEIEAVCIEAQMHNVRVASHTSGGPSITTAVRSGIHSVEHGHWLDNETINLMAEKNTFYVPTLLVNERNFEFEHDTNFTKSKNWKWLKLSREAKWKSLDKAINSNVQIALGTDAGFMLPHGSMNYREMEYMVQGGMSNMQAIKAATQFGGKLLELNVGTIEVGQRADILIVKGNPLKDIKVLKNRENIEIFKDGKKFDKHSFLSN